MHSSSTNVAMNSDSRFSFNINDNWWQLGWICFHFWEWLIDYLRVYVPLKNISLIWRRHHCRWRAAKFRPMLGTLGLWAGRDLYRGTPAVTRGLGFSGVIRRTAPFSGLLRHTRVCGWSILTQILTGIATRQSFNTKSFWWTVEK
jgi:hypothetical protein